MDGISHLQIVGRRRWFERQFCFFVLWGAMKSLHQRQKMKYLREAHLCFREAHPAHAATASFLFSLFLSISLYLSLRRELSNKRNGRCWVGAGGPHHALGCRESFIVGCHRPRRHFDKHWILARRSKGLCFYIFIHAFANSIVSSWIMCWIISRDGKNKQIRLGFLIHALFCAIKQEKE